MGRYGFKVTLTEEAYENLRKVKELLGARSWEEMSRRLLELVRASADGDADTNEAPNKGDSQVKRMTPRQRSYIWRLAKKVMAREGLTMAELRDRIKEEVGVELGEEMGREEASKVIGWLEGRAGEA